MIAIGLMSGTSLDGIDAALVNIKGSGAKTSIELIQSTTLPYENKMKARIKQACDPKNSNVPLISQLNMELGYHFLQACQQVCQEANVSTNCLDFVASHGQTIWHEPSSDTSYPNTFQIGEPSVIAYGLKTVVVSDFRMMDMAAGGEGAPLVPYSESILYQSKENSRLLQNIGGIGNVTVLPKNGNLNDIFAFDTGPGNMIIDEVMTQLFGKAFDESGETAAKGTIIPSLQKVLHDHDYLAITPPKSTGRELFGIEFTDTLLKQYNQEDPYDVVTTVTDFTAFSIAESYRRFVFPKIGTENVQVILGGGGAHNLTLKAMLESFLPEVEILTQDDFGQSSDAKEAIAFAIMGNETLHKKPSNVPSATGAKNAVILGNITPNPFENS